MLCSLVLSGSLEDGRGVRLSSVTLKQEMQS